MSRTRKIIWITTAFVAIFLSVITFTPLIIPDGRYRPEFMGMPYTLWSGILLMIAFILDTLVAIFVHPGNDNDN